MPIYQYLTFIILTFLVGILPACTTDKGNSHSSKIEADTPTLIKPEEVNPPSLEIQIKNQEELILHYLKEESQRRISLEDLGKYVKDHIQTTPDYNLTFRVSPKAPHSLIDTCIIIVTDLGVKRFHFIQEKNKPKTMI